MRGWLVITACVCFAWTWILLAVPQWLLASRHVAEYPIGVYAAAGCRLLFGMIALWSALDPRKRRKGIYVTIVALLTAWIVDTYAVLFVLPAQQAARVLADLIICVALVVGVLEALPRVVNPKEPG